MYYIYRITNIKNGCTYIGQHKCPIDKTPWNDHYMGSGLILYNAKRKYGLECFKKDIIVANILDKKSIDDWERTFIMLERLMCGAEYNIKDGGQGGSTIYDNGMRGKHHTSKSKEKIRRMLTGHNNGQYGKTSFAAKKVQCIETGEIFDSVALAGKKYNVSSSALCNKISRGHDSDKSWSKSKLKNLHFKYL